MNKLLLLLLMLPLVATAQIGIDTESPSEDLHIVGTARFSDLPLNGTANAISTTPSGNPATGQNQTFNATRTVVADKNGVLGTVAYLPITVNPNAGGVKYKFNSAIIDDNTRTNSETTLGNISVRFNAESNHTGRRPLEFRLNGFNDKVIANTVRIETGGGNGGQDSFDAVDGDWNVVDDAMPNINSQEFTQYNISLLRTNEVYRVSMSVNGTINQNAPDVSSPRQVTIFIERLKE